MNEAEPESEPDRRAELVVVEALPGLARIAAGAWVRGAAWGLGASLRLSKRIAEAALASDAVREVGSGMRAYARELLGVKDLDERVRELMPSSTPSSRMRNGSRPHAKMSLREQGAELLRQSADVQADDDMHPAYERILAEIAPDEARILRLLATSGPQAVVDVRSANLIGVGSQLVAPHLNMIGTEAGCRHIDRVPAYLNNLQRLGLVCFSDAPIDDLVHYQVIEAQPETTEAMKRAGRPRTVHRSLRLTAFGEDFCRMVLPAPAELPRGAETA
jgi:Abortive infection alpha